MTTRTNVRWNVRSAVLPVLLLAACAGSPPDPPEPPLRPEGAPAQRLADGDGLQNVARISDVLYRGAQPEQAGYAKLREMGVKTVVSLRRFHDTRVEAEAEGLEFVPIPIYAAVGSKAPTELQVKQFFDTVLDPEKQPVYLHCKFGKDRTGMMSALYRIECDGWSNADAIAEMQAFGYRDIYFDMIDYVRGYRRHGFVAPPRTQGRAQ